MACSHFCMMEGVSSGVSYNLVQLACHCCRLCGVGLQCAAMDVIKVKYNNTAVKKTPVQHVSKFRKDTFCVKGSLLRCKMCDVPVHHDSQ